MTQRSTHDPVYVCRPVPLEGVATASGLRAYQSEASCLDSLGLTLLPTCYRGEPVPGVRVAADDAALAASTVARPDLLTPVTLPADPTARAHFVAEWVRKHSRQSRAGLLPFLLLPLAACGGGGAVPAGTTDGDSPGEDLFALVALLGGLWSVGGDHGDVALARQGADFVLTPARGAAVTLAAVSVNGLVLPQITLSADAADLSGVKVTGLGEVALFKLEEAPSADLSGITAAGLTAQLDATGGVVFAAAADLGAAVVTISAATAVAADTVTFTAGAGLASARFVVDGTATLVLTDSQIDTVSNTAAITGSGHVMVAAQLDATAAQSVAILVKVALNGAGGSSSLTFDLPADDNDTVVLTAGSSIALNGGTLIVDDGEVDLRNLSNATDFSGVANVRINSGLTLTVDQLAGVTNIETEGSGRLDILIEKAQDVSRLVELLGDPARFGTIKPAFSVQVAGDVAAAAEIESLLVAAAADLATAAGVGVPVTRLDGSRLLSAPEIALAPESDTGLYHSDGLSSDNRPVLNILLPNNGPAPSDGDRIAVVVTQAVGATPGTPQIVVLDSDSTTGNLRSDANGNLFVTVTLDLLPGEGVHFVAAAMVTGADMPVPGTSSNLLRYVLDTTAPMPEAILLSAQTVSAGQTQALDVTLTFTETVIGFDSDQDIIYDTGLGTLSQMVSADGGQTWTGQFLPSATVQEGSTRLVISAGSFTDLAGNPGQGGQSAPLLIDLVPPAAPVIDIVADDDILGQAEVGTTITGTAEANAIVTLHLGAQAPRLVQADAAGHWAYTLVPDDLVAMDEGPVTLGATAKDAAGNTGATAERLILVDTVIEAPVSQPAFGTGLLNVALRDSLITAVAAGGDPVVLAGQAEAGAVIMLADDSGVAVMTTTADTSGAWSFHVSDFSAQDGLLFDILAESTPAQQLRYSVTATDVAGNLSPEIVGLLEIDTEPPALALLQVDGVTGATEVLLGARDLQAFAADPDVVVLLGDAGTADVTVTVTLTPQGPGAGAPLVAVVTAPAEAAPTGPAYPWVVTARDLGINAALADGTYLVAIQGQDPAGNTDHSQSEALVLTIDSTAPEDFQVTVNPVAADGLDPADLVALAAAPETVLLYGTVRDAAYVALDLLGVDDVPQSGMPQFFAVADGSWAITADDLFGDGQEEQELPPFALDLYIDREDGDGGDAGLTSGLYRLRLVAFDAAGNESQEVIIEIALAGAQVMPGDLDFADFVDTGVPGDLRTVDNTFTLTTTGGSAGIVPTFELSLDGGTSWTSTNAQQSDLEPGLYTFRALVNDVAGSAIPTSARTVEIAESQLDLIEIARFGDDLSVGVMFKSEFDPDPLPEPGIGAFDMVIDLSNATFAILPESVVFADGVTGLANLVAGQLNISAFALPDFKDFDSPIFQFTASRQDQAPQLDIVIEDIFIENAYSGSAMSSFAFTSVLSELG